MKLLAHMGISVSTIASLREARHDSVHLRDEGLLKIEDADILDKARSEGRIVLTFDLWIAAICWRPLARDFRA